MAPKKGRWPEVTLLVAAKKHGKSTTAEWFVRNNSQPNGLIYKEGINLYDEAFYGKYPVVDDIYSYRGGKVIVNGGNIEYRPFLDLVYNKYRNGSLVIDDAGIYESDVVTPELKRILIDSRKLGLDVLLMFHCLSDVPIKMFPYVNNIILGHTTGNFRHKVKKLPNNGQELIEMQQRIAYQALQKGNKFYREFYKLS